MEIPCINKVILSYPILSYPNKGEGEGGGKFLKPPPPPHMARLESAKEVKVSRSFGLGTEKCLNYE